MTAEQIERNRAFLADLRANEKKSVTMMRREDGSRCCLCVAQDTANNLGANLLDNGNTMPNHGIADFYGWPHYNPRLRVGGQEHEAAWLNDGISGAPLLTHAEIADAFEETFPELKP